ncbi:MAG: hypothetical protein ACFE9T_06545 [Promethearchaeota archaeon]
MINEQLKSFIQEHLGYTEEELNIFFENPNNIEILNKAPNLMKNTIVIEVVKAHGCNSQHKVGDKFYFDGFGNLLTKLCPKRICINALSAVEKLIYASNALSFAGVDPNKIQFNRVGCSDVGLQCGGWGNIVMEIKVEDRKKE